MPRISIVVPIFNGIRYLPYFFESLAENVPRDTELILVDDCSSEPVLEAVPDLLPVGSVTKLRNDRNRGYSATVNRGFARATGDVLVQLNTDLILTPRCIDAMVDLIARAPQVGIVGSKQVLPTTGLVRHAGMAFGKCSYRHVFAGLPADHPLCSKTRQVQLVSGATAAMTKQVLGVIGPLDERYYNTHENFVHCLVAQERGYVNYVCADSVVHHWVGQSGPARFARVEEDDALFWAEWASRRRVDLGTSLDESLDHALGAHPEMADYAFEPIRLCRSQDESILLERIEQQWPGASQRLHDTRIFNSAHEKLWLPMELPFRAMMSPAPYIYIVDRISQLAENRLWFEARKRIVTTEMIVDARAVVVTSDELLRLFGGPL